MKRLEAPVLYGADDRGGEKGVGAEDLDAGYFTGIGDAGLHFDVALDAHLTRDGVCVFLTMARIASGCATRISAKQGSRDATHKSANAADRADSLHFLPQPGDKNADFGKDGAVIGFH